MAFKRNKQRPSNDDTTVADEAPAVSGLRGGDPSRRTASSSGGGSTTTAVADPIAPELGDRDVFAGGITDEARIASPEKLAGVSKGRLGNLLIERELVTESQLEQGLAAQLESGGRIGEVLVSMGMLDDRDLVEALSIFLGVPVINLRVENVEPRRSPWSPRTSPASSSPCPSASLTTASTSLRPSRARSCATTSPRSPVAPCA